MKNINKISLKIIILFSVNMIMSLIPEYYPNFFNDTVCNGTILNIETNKYEYYSHNGSGHKDLKYHWGYRHYLYFIMEFCLFILQAI